MTSTRQLLPLLVVFGICLTFITQTESAPVSQFGGGGEEPYELNENPEEALLYLLARVERTLLKARDPGFSKRIVDFGLARGYSGMQEAKHRMGMAAANFAGGPGRRRRSIDQS